VKEMGNNLREYRKKSGLTAAAIAEAANISTTYYYELEKGTKRLNIETLESLSKLFGASIDSIAGVDITKPVISEEMIGKEGMSLLEEIAAGLNEAASKGIITEEEKVRFLQDKKGDLEYLLYKKLKR